jgi:HK97 family phage major capsid protein
VDLSGPGAGLVLHPTGWNKLRKVAAAAGTPKVYAGVGHSVIDEACDIKAFKTTQLAATDALVGQFSELIVANWAGIVFAASKETADAFAKNQTHIRAILLVDIGVRQPAAFCWNAVFGT